MATRATPTRRTKGETLHVDCGNCQRNCPYCVIRMDGVPAKKPGLLSWMFFGGGPACVRVCPTGGAIRVSPEDFLTVARLDREAN